MHSSNAPMISNAAYMGRSTTSDALGFTGRLEASGVVVYEQCERLPRLQKPARGVIDDPAWVCNYAWRTAELEAVWPRSSTRVMDRCSRPIRLLLGGRAPRDPTTCFSRRCSGSNAAFRP